MYAVMWVFLSQSMFFNVCVCMADDFRCKNDIKFVTINWSETESHDPRFNVSQQQNKMNGIGFFLREVLLSEKISMFHWELK